MNPNVVLCLFLGLLALIYVGAWHSDRLRDEREASWRAQGCELLGKDGVWVEVKPGVTVRGQHWICDRRKEK